MLFARNRQLDQVARIDFAYSVFEVDLETETADSNLHNVYQYSMNMNHESYSNTVIQIQ